MTEPDLSILPQRMREAAAVLAEATDRSRKATGSQAGEATCTSMEFWCEQDMLRFADEWEAQDLATDPVEQLARELDEVNESTLAYNRATARILVAQGWRKEVTA